MPEPPNIDARDVFAQLFAHPASASLHIAEIVWRNFDAHAVSIAVIVAVFWVVRIGLRRMHRRVSIREALSARGRGRQRRRARQTMLASIGSLIAWITFVLILAGQLGLTISPTTYSWVIGAMSLAAAFALRTYLADAIAGLNAVFTDTYAVGDYIDLGFGVAGTVEHVGLWTTSLRGSDGAVHSIRNSDMARVANRTQSAGRLLTDVTLTKHDESPVTPKDLDEFERIAAATLVDLRSVLHDVNRIARDGESADDITSLAEVAAVVPSLAPNLSFADLDAVRKIDDGDSDVLPILSDAIAAAPSGATPVFRGIENLGLVTSTASSVTIRLRVVLEDPRGRSFGLVLLRRRLFDVFAERGVSTGFTDVVEGEFID